MKTSFKNQNQNHTQKPIKKQKYNYTSISPNLSMLTKATTDFNNIQEQWHSLELRVPQQECSSLIKTLRKYEPLDHRIKVVFRAVGNGEKKVKFCYRDSIDEKFLMYVKERYDNVVFGVEFVDGFQLSIYDNMKKLIPEDVQIPHSHEVIGNIVNLNLVESQLPYRYHIGVVLLNKIKNVRTVVCKMNRLDKENVFRTTKFELVAGIDQMETRVTEHGNLFDVVVGDVFWNTNLSSERQRVSTQLKPNEKVADLYAGVGPFAVLAAKKKCIVYANDLNPVACELMYTNADLNKVTINVQNMPDRDYIDYLNQNDVQIDHFYMNLPGAAIHMVSHIYSYRNFSNSKLHVYLFSSTEFTVREELTKITPSPLTFHNIHLVKEISPKRNIFCTTISQTL